MEWISFKEKYPKTKSIDGEYEISDYVLGICSDMSYAVVQFELYNDGKIYWTDETGYSKKVTHWMSLPEPPKED